MNIKNKSHVTEQPYVKIET